MRALTSIMFAVFFIFCSMTYAAADVYRWKYQHAKGYTILEILDDDLIHVAFGAGSGPAPGQDTIFTSTMVFKKNYTGPKNLTVSVDKKSCETAELSVQIINDGCVSVTDRVRGFLTTVCPDSVSNAWKQIGIAKGNMKNVYGLGQHFWGLGSSDGDWINQTKSTDGPNGNTFAGYYGGADSQIQFPIYFALANNNLNYGFFLDNVYKHTWDFNGTWWHTGMNGSEVRFYILTGPDLIDVRKDFMELTGTPPVPPKKAFGLWISEFGFDNWDEIDWKIYGNKNGETGLRGQNFPFEGAVLDLQWFGAVKANSPDSRIGSLSWDENRFPNPAGNIQRLLNDHIGLIAIEESYIATGQWSFGQMSNRGTLVRWNCGGPVWTSNQWMGNVGMIDWSNDSGSAWWHDTLRQPNLINKGILGHWTDLGEPEMYTDNGCYAGIEPGKHNHPDIHNIYNLLWHRAIYKGYVRNHGTNVNRRPFLLARAGAPGIQRFGAAMWSGDIASRLDVLASHMRASMHMAFSGIDYYGTDIGGFWRRSVWDDTKKITQGPSEDEMFTQWLANSAWFDIPVRTHTYNCGFDPGMIQDPSVHCPYEVSPAWVGFRWSNLQNIRQRYELTPYYYSLAHRAYLYGEPVIPPVVMYYQNDPVVRTMGHEKLIGRDLLAGIVMGYGQKNRDMYLPEGGWYNYHTNQWNNSHGMWLNVPVWFNGILRLPVFAKAGAIISLLHVDAQTKDVFGHRKDGSRHDEFITKIYLDESNIGKSYAFTVYEDDGSTVNRYDSSERPKYKVRTTDISQVNQGSYMNITIDAVKSGGGQYDGLYTEDNLTNRNNELRIVTNKRKAGAVTLNGQTLPEITSFETFYSSPDSTGWYNLADWGEILIRTGPYNINTAKNFKIDFSDENGGGQSKRTVIFIYGKTNVGQDMFLRGGIDWNYSKNVLGIDCSAGESAKWLCAIPIVHNIFNTDPQRANDHYLDWYGAEPGQGNVEGTPLVWTTNDPNYQYKVDNDGYGYTPLNQWGQHYWMLDVTIDCGKTNNGWFELKSFISNGPGWEPNVQQPSTPYVSGNHFAQCGKINVFRRGESVPVAMLDF